MVVTSELTGFKKTQRSLVYDQRPRQIDFQLALGTMSETVTVAGEAPLIDMRSAEISRRLTVDEIQPRSQGFNNRRDQRAQAPAEPSANVQNLQRRAAGVLPVRIDVPRTGTSHRFLKPLVIDEETVVGFRYRRR
jgi:hypothetical protein